MPSACGWITPAGIKRIAPVWAKYCALSAKLLEGIPVRDLKAHLAVNEAISVEIRKWRAGVSDRLPPDF